MTESGGVLEAYHDGPNGKQYFHPDDQQPNAIPPGMNYHRKGTTWKPDQWGYDPEIAEKNKVKRAEAAQVREKHSKDVKDIHANTMAIFIRKNAWDIHPEICKCVRIIDSTLSDLRAKRNEHREKVKIREIFVVKPSDSQAERKDKIKKRNEEIYNQEVPWLKKDSTTLLTIVNEFLEAGKRARNKFGDELPQHRVADSQTNIYFISVLIAYLGAIKHEIMSATVFKVKDHPEWPEAQAFIAESHKASNLMGKILKKRKFKKFPKWRKDSAALNDLHTFIGQADYKLFKETHTDNARVPKHLQRYAPGWKEAQAAKRGKGKKGGNAGPPPGSIEPPQSTRPGRGNRQHSVPGHLPAAAAKRQMYSEPYY